MGNSPVSFSLVARLTEGVATGTSSPHSSRSSSTMTGGVGQACKHSTYESLRCRFSGPWNLSLAS